MDATILALDLASRTGYAWWKPGMEKPKAGVYDLPSEVNRGAWFKDLYEWAREFAGAIGATDIAFESPLIGFGDQNKNMMLITAAGLMEMVGHEISASTKPIANNSMFAHWVGPVHEEDRKGKDWRKNYSLLAAQRHGWMVKDHNIADALGVLNYRTWQLDIKTPWDNKKNPGNLFRVPQGVRVDKSNERAATVLVNRAMSFDAGKG